MANKKETEKQYRIERAEARKVYRVFEKSEKNIAIINQMMVALKTPQVDKDSTFWAERVQEHIANLGEPDPTKDEKNARDTLGTLFINNQQLLYAYMVRAIDPLVQTRIKETLVDAYNKAADTAEAVSSATAKTLRNIANKIGNASDFAEGFKWAANPFFTIRGAPKELQDPNVAKIFGAVIGGILGATGKCLELLGKAALDVGKAALDVGKAALDVGKKAALDVGKAALDVGKTAGTKIAEFFKFIRDEIIAPMARAVHSVLTKFVHGARGVASAGLIGLAGGLAGASRAARSAGENIAVKDKAVAEKALDVLKSKMFANEIRVEPGNAEGVLVLRYSDYSEAAGVANMIGSTFSTQKVNNMFEVNVPTDKAEDLLGKFAEDINPKGSKKGKDILKDVLKQIKQDSLQGQPVDESKNSSKYKPGGY